MASGRPSEQQRAAAVVIGIDCITGLQTARILARRGVAVTGIAFDASRPCARTRVCERIVPSDATDGALLRTLDRLARTLGARAVLYPCTDASVLFVAHNREQLLPSYHVPLAPSPTVQALADKASFIRCAEAAGVPLPRTVLLREPADVARAADTLTFPCLLKPGLRTEAWNRSIREKVIRLERPHDLDPAYGRCAPFAETLIAQEWIDGSDAELYSCNGYFDRSGDPLATFVARKVRQWPPRTGVSSLGVECRNDTVRDYALRLFRSVGFHGLGYLEVKRDTRTGEHLAIEANVGRPTGRSAIAEAGGVELLYTMYCDACGLALPERREQRYGSAKWIYWRQDVRSAFHYWRAGELSLREWIRSCRGPKATAVFSWTDPMPFVCDLVHVTRRAGNRRVPSAVPARRHPRPEARPLSRRETA